MDLIIPPAPLRRTQTPLLPTPKPLYNPYYRRTTNTTRSNQNIYNPYYKKTNTYIYNNNRNDNTYNRNQERNKTTIKELEHINNKIKNTYEKLHEILKVFKDADPNNFNHSETDIVTVKQHGQKLNRLDNTLKDIIQTTDSVTTIISNNKKTN